MNKDIFTSPLVTLPALVVWILGFLAAVYMSNQPAACLFLALILLTVVTRWWGALAIRNVSLDVRCLVPRLFPGQTTILSYRVTNDKFLPLPWLELSQNAPPKDCLVPDAEFSRVHAAGTSPDSLPVLRRAFAGIAGHSTLSVDHVWTASRRGLYIIRDLTARSGDGFGLVQREASVPHSRIPVLAVYPALVHVDLSPFRQIRWDARASRNGWMEDRTILHGNREYQPGDSWKSINWRMAAREQGLPVNLYQTVSPFSVRFLLDGESFVSQPDSLEEALSILASLITGLASHSMDLSLSLPQSRDLPAATLHADAGDPSELLYHLAGYECLAQRDMGVPLIDGIPTYLPSLFPADAAGDEGSLWLITRSGRQLPEALLHRLPTAATTILCFEEEDAPALMGYRALSIRTLRR